MYECKVCGKQYEDRHKFLGHCSAHKRNGGKLSGKEPKIPRIKIDENWKQENGLYKCPECGMEKTRMGICSHILLTHKGEKSNLIAYNKKGLTWNKGMTKATDQRVFKLGREISKTILRQIKEGKFVKRKMSEDAKNRLSIEQSLRNRGGKCKWYEVNGIKVQGTWERNLALKMSELEIQWHKPRVNKDVFSYFDIKKKSYSPDFYLPEFDLLLETKGYWWGNDKQKMKLVVEQNMELKQKLVIIQVDLFQKLLKTKTKDEFIRELSKDGDTASE
jgi:hypothetical protein